MFYRKAQFIVSTCIAVLLLLLCFEVAHMERAIAQNQLQKVAICDPNSPDTCAEIGCFGDGETEFNTGKNQRNVCYLAADGWIGYK